MSLRGSNSMIWGSGAIGGVIALTTPETKGVLASIGNRPAATTLPKTSPSA